MSVISHLKNVKVVLVKPYDDKSIEDVCIVEHNSKGLKAFEIDWEKAFDKVKEGYPENWSVGQIWTIMEKKGWRVITPKSLTVTY